MQKTAYILLRVKLVGAVLLNQFIVQTKDENRGSPLPDEKSLIRRLPADPEFREKEIYDKAKRSGNLTFSGLISPGERPAARTRAWMAAGDCFYSCSS
jgi:hypothetical protein